MSDLEKEIEKLIQEKKLAQEAAKSLNEQHSFKIVKSNDTTVSLLNNIKEEKKIVDVNFKSNLNLESDNYNFATTEKFKIETLKQLREAKGGHKKWMSYVQILIRLGNVKEAQTAIPVNYTMCDFGKWYYGDGQNLMEFTEFVEIESIHQNVHDTYLKIYNLYKLPLKSSLFKNMGKLEKERLIKAEYLSKTLDKYSKELFDLINSIIDKIKKMDIEEFSKLIG